MKRLTPWAVLLLLNAFAFGMLGLYQTGHAGSPPFANTTESRLDMVEQLKEIRDLLKEQNALLRSGEVKVIVTELPKAGEVPRPTAPRSGRRRCDGTRARPAEPVVEDQQVNRCIAAAPTPVSHCWNCCWSWQSSASSRYCPGFPSTQPSLYEQLDSTAHIVATELAYGRSLAVSNNDQYRFSWDLPNNRFYAAIRRHERRLFQTLPNHRLQPAPGDPPNQHIVDLDELPHIGPTVQLAAVVSSGSTTAPVTTLAFSPLGGTVSAVPATIWLSAGSGDSTRYITVTMKPVTGLATVGSIRTTGPPSGLQGTVSRRSGQ